MTKSVSVPENDVARVQWPDRNTRFIVTRSWRLLASGTSPWLQPQTHCRHPQANRSRGRKRLDSCAGPTPSLASAD